MRLTMLAVFVLAACASRASRKGMARDTTDAGWAREQVLAAVQASGGTDALGKVDGYHLEAKGTWLGQPYTEVSYFREPGDWRWDMQMTGFTMSGWVLGEERDAYMNAGGGKATTLDGKMRANMVAHMNVASCMLCPDRLLDPSVKLEKADRVTIDGTEHAAVRALFADSDPATFVFDPATNRIRRVMFMMPDMETQEPTPAFIEMSDWRDVGDIAVAHRGHMEMGTGEKRMAFDSELTKLVWNPEIPEGILDAPEAAPPPEMAVKRVDEARVVEHTFVGPYHEVGAGIQQTMAWIGANGGQPAGPVTLVYRELPNPEDFNQSKTVVQVPVQMEGTTVPGDTMLLRRPAFLFAYTTYEGHASGCHLMIETVKAWCAENGYEPAKKLVWRVSYLKMDPETGQCVAEVGLPVRKK